MKGYQVSNSHGLRCMLPLLLGLVAISGLGALITCLASRLAFHNKAAILEHLHSLLLTASLLLLGLAILQHRLPCTSRRVGKLLHALLAAGGLGLGVVGLWAGWWQRRTSASNFSLIRVAREESPEEEFTLTTKELISTNYRDQNLTELEIEPKFDSSSLPLFHSPHALLGLLTLGCIALQMIMGLFLLIFPCFGRTRSSYLPLHTFFGLALFISITCTALLGVGLERGARNELRDRATSLESVLENCLGLLLCVFCTSVCYIATKPSFKQFE